MTENQTEFDGPRKIRLEEAASGAELYKICFHGDLDNAEESARPVRRGGWYVIVGKDHRTRDGQVVTQAGLFHNQVELYGCRLRVGSIGGVGTHPDYREQGLAGRLLIHSAGVFAREGARLMLISGERGLYTRTGNIPAMRFTGLILKASHSPLPFLFSPGFTVRPLVATDRLTCARLYHTEPAHFVRRPEDFTWHCSTAGEGWMVEQAGVPRAYLLLFTPWEFHRGPERGIREVLEYAGSRLALVEGMRRVLSGMDSLQPPIHELRLAIPWQDADFLQLLTGWGSMPERMALPGHTMRLLNFPALRKDLAGYIQSRLPDDLRRRLHFHQSGPLMVDPDQGGVGEGCMAITWKGQRNTIEILELTGAEMTALVMGSCSSPPVLSGALGEIVPTLFPLPSFSPGINYQ